MISYLKRQKWIWLDRNQLRKKIASNDVKLKVIIGAGKTNYTDWIATDYPVFNVKASWQWKFLFGKIKVRNLLAEHVFEHFKEDEVEIALRNCYEYLEDGGVLRIAVPDEYHPNKKYIDYVRPGGIGPGADDHKSFWNCESISEISRSIGFKTSLIEYWDSSINFHFQDDHPDHGPIIRSKGYGFKTEISDYSSLIIDLRK